MKIGFCYKTDDGEYTLCGVDKEVIEILLGKVENEMMSYITKNATKDKIDALKELINYWNELNDLLERKNDNEL